MSVLVDVPALMMSEEMKVRIYKGSKVVWKAYLTLPEIEAYKDMGYEIKVM